MPLNVEIKARCNSPEKIHQILKAQNAEFKGIDHQIDTYFDVPNGRLKLREGNIEEAYKHLRKCEELKKGDPQVAWVWARVRQEDGLYEDAIAAYTYVLKAFPNDRAARRQLGRTYYLDQQYEASISMYKTVLDIDPEDREAYYHLALNYRAIGNTAEAAIMDKAFNYYKIDESASEAAQKYRMENPGANKMAQDIRIHNLEF